MDENNVQKEAEMMVSYAWIVKEYGAVLAKKMRDVAENNYFLETPLDRKGHATYFQHEGKEIVRVRYSVVKKVNNQGGREARHKVDDTDKKSSSCLLLMMLVGLGKTSDME